MPQVHRSWLRGFLEGQGVDQAWVNRAMAALEPLYVMAEAGEIRLKPTHEVDLREVAGVISRTIGKEVGEVVPIRVVPETLRYYGLGAVFWNSFGNRLYGRLGDMCLGCLWHDLEHHLFASLGRSLKESLKENLWDTSEDGLWKGPFYYLCFMLARWYKRAEKIEPLVLQQASGVFIVGENADEPSVWLTLVA